MTERKPTFFTSDWHLFHENALKFDARPFKDVEHMHETLINNYNATVPKDGICYFLGDVGMSQATQLYKIISRLNGTKVLVLGNHDKGMSAMYKAGFDVVMQGASLIIAKQFVTMSHCPLLGTFREDVSGFPNPNGVHWHGEHKLAQFSFPNFGQFHLHGHIHSRKDKPISKKIEGRQYDVGVAANGYRPVSISEIESFIADNLRREPHKYRQE